MVATTTAYCILSCALFFTAAHAGKILVIPGDGSHWINIKVLIMELVQRGHELTVCRPSNSMYIDETSEHFKIEDIPVPETQKFSRKEFEEFALDWVFQQAFTKHSSSFTMALDFIVALNFGSQMISGYLGAIFENTDVMERLTNASFDLILADPYNVAGVMLAHYMKLPIVFFGRWMPTEDIHFAIAPSPLSYVPVLNSRVSDRMAFHERVKNVALYYLYLAATHLLVYPIYDKLAYHHFNSDIGVLEMYKRADIHLMKVDFVFEFPRPTMPNAIYIGGFQGRPPKPLSEDIQRFMDSSEHGVVVFSLGSLVSRLPLHLAQKIAAGLAQLKEQVIWRYSGEPLDTLGNNTMTLDWLPQNDLLGHPNTKVFLAHGGENGIYEALYHGVPIVGFPLYGDQYENLLRLKVRGAAIILENLQDITAKDIFNAVRTVIDDPSYSRAIKYLSGLHRDTPVPPLDLAVFWTEYVMRHKGARHLQPAANDLAWYQYYLLDVIGFLLITVLVSVYITIRIFRVVLRTFCCRKQNKQKQKKS